MKNFKKLVTLNGLTLWVLALALALVPEAFLAHRLPGEATPEAQHFVRSLGLVFGVAGVLLLSFGRVTSQWAQVRLISGLSFANVTAVFVAFYRQNHVLQSTPGTFVLLVLLLLFLANALGLLRHFLSGEDPQDAGRERRRDSRWPMLMDVLIMSLLPASLLLILASWHLPTEFRQLLLAPAPWARAPVLALCSMALFATGWLLTWQQRRDLEAAEQTLAAVLAGQRVGPLRTHSLLMHDFGRGINRWTGADGAAGSIRDLRLQEMAEAAATEERNRLARDLHDSIKQQLFSIKMSSAAVDARWETNPEGARSSLQDVRRSAHEAMVEMQALLLQLRPHAMANIGLVEALREQCEALQYRSGATVHCKIDPLPPESDLPPTTQQTVFRIAQEALSNVSRHARAKNVSVRLWRENRALFLSVEDDGQGFDLQEWLGGQGKGFGLPGMKERLQFLDGTLDLDAEPGAGTRLQVAIPLSRLSEPEPMAEQSPADSPSLELHAFSPMVLLGLCASLIPGILPGSLFRPEAERVLSTWLLAGLLLMGWTTYGWYRWQKGKRKVSRDARDLRLFLLFSAAYWWTPQFWWNYSRAEPFAVLGAVAVGSLVGALAALPLLRLLMRKLPYLQEQRRTVWLLATVLWLPTLVLPNLGYATELFMLPTLGGLLTVATYLGAVVALWGERRKPHEAKP